MRVQNILQKKSEWMMFFAGAAIIASALVVWQTDSLVFWWIAKAWYAVGVILVVLDR